MEFYWYVNPLGLFYAKRLGNTGKEGKREGRKEGIEKL